MEPVTEAEGQSTQETIGERLRRLRLERGLSQRELSAQGVSYAYISRIEAGARRPSVKALRMLARKLGVAPIISKPAPRSTTPRTRAALAEAELKLRLDDRRGRGRAEARGRCSRSRSTAGDSCGRPRARSRSAWRRPSARQVARRRAASRPASTSRRSRPRAPGRLRNAGPRVGGGRAGRAARSSSSRAVSNSSRPRLRTMRRRSALRDVPQLGADRHRRLRRAQTCSARRSPTPTGSSTPTRASGSTGRRPPRLDQGRAAVALDYFRRADRAARGDRGHLHLAPRPSLLRLDV